MSLQSVSFELFRYQILPVNRYIQLDLLSNVGSVEELILRKNDFFAEALASVSDFSSARIKTNTKLVYSRDDFSLLRIAHNRSLNIEKEDFTDEVIQSWPSVFVAIWNDPEKQIIAIQKRTSAFSKCSVVTNIIVEAVKRHLSHHNLTIKVKPLFEKQEFWALLDNYANKVTSVEFDVITPNMANISSSLTEDYKEFLKSTNSSGSSIKMKSDDNGYLHLEKSNSSLDGLVDYSSEGGGNISIKVEGYKKKFKTSKTVKEISMGEFVLEGDSEVIVQTLKELLSS